jgi:TrmH family RNA methyltransferase
MPGTRNRSVESEIMPAIATRQHAIVKQFRAVARGDENRLLLDGWHLLAEAAAGDLTVDLIALAGGPPARHAALIDRLHARGATIVRVTAPVLNAISPVRTPSGVVATANRPRLPLERLAQPAPALIVAACGLQDPGNAGAVIRAAAAAGATGALFDTASADPFGWKALRASMGSALHLPVRRDADAHDVLSRWRAEGFAMILAEPQGGRPFREVSLTGPTVVVIGGEGGGVPDPVRRLATERITIPMRAPVESLNAAVAAGLVLYEAERQRT